MYATASAYPSQHVAGQTDQASSSSAVRTPFDVHLPSTVQDGLWDPYEGVHDTRSANASAAIEPGQSHLSPSMQSAQDVDGQSRQSELTRNGSVARTDAIAKLKRAASQREMRTRSPGPNFDDTSMLQESRTAITNANVPYSHLDRNGLTGTNALNGTSQQNFGSSSIATSPLPPALRDHSPRDAALPPTLLGVPTNRSGGSRSPLPSLEQLRARILHERETAGLARSASTSAASAAARQYAMEKLLGASGREGAVSPVSDTAEDPEEEDKRMSVVKAERVMLRRSRTIGGLSATAEAQRKAAFVQALDEGVPDDLRNLRRSSRRFAHDPPGRDVRTPGDVQEENSALYAGATLDRAASQRQIARTEMLRKLSTRRGAQSPADALNEALPNDNRTADASAAPSAPVEDPTTSSVSRRPSSSSSKRNNDSDARHVDKRQVALSPPLTPLHATPAPITPSPNLSSRLLTVPLGSVARSPSTHSSAMGLHEDERNRASAMARLYGEEAFEYERLLELGYTTDDAFERVASARSGSYVEYGSAISPRSVQDEFKEEEVVLPSTPLMAYAKAGLNQQVLVSGTTFQSPGTGVPVNVSPTHASNPNTAQMHQDEWASKHPSEASIPLGFDPSVVRDDARSDERSSSGGDARRQLSLNSSKGGERTSSLQKYPENVIAASSNSLAAISNGGGEAKAERPTLTVMPPRQVVPMERIEDLLTPGFLAEVGNPLDYSHSPARSPDMQRNPLDRRNSNSGSSESADVAEPDEEDDDDNDDDRETDYLQHVDKMTRRLERFMRKSNRAQRDTAVQQSSAAQAQAAASDYARRQLVTDSQTAEEVLKGDGRDTSPRRLTPMPVGQSASVIEEKSKSLSSDAPNVQTSPERGDFYSTNEKLAPFPALLTSHEGVGMPMAKLVKRKPSPLAGATPEADFSGEGEKEGANVPPSADPSQPDVQSVQVKETFFSSLRRKASRKGAVATQSVPLGDDVRPDSPSTKKLSSFLSRKTSTKGLNSPPVSSKLNGAGTTKNETLNEQDQDAGGKRDVQNVIVPEQVPAVRALTKESMHSRNDSVGSIATTQPQDDFSLALDSGRANRAPTLSAPASLAPATAAVLHRYSRLLTSPNEAAKLPDIPGLSAQQIDSPPRQFVMAAPILQVVTASTVKDRFIFLFSDIVVLAKPVRAPSKDTDAHALPNLSWTFSVKSILSLDEIKLTMPKGERRQNPVHTPIMSVFEKQFRTAPREALQNVIRESGLPNDPTTMAKLLHQTPDLDRQSLSNLLFDKANGQIMRAFIYQEKFAGVSIESALRSLWLELRFPPKCEALQDMLVAFAQQWTETNRGLIKDTFTARLAVELIVAIMSLNDALHSHHADTPGTFHRSQPSMSKDEFIESFRAHDPAVVLSDRTLLRIYSSVSADAIQQALLPHESVRSIVRILAPGVPTRIVYGQPSEPIRIAIPRADPGFVVRLYGQDLTFQPQVLSFDKSHVQEFRVLSKSLGPHSIVFARAGRNARNYQAFANEIGEDFLLPRSINLSVQRAFMQHCFTLTLSGKRRFLISVEDEAKRRAWLRGIKERLEKRQKLVRTGDVASSGSAYAMALHVLRETLIQPDASTHNAALQRSASTASPMGTISPSKSAYGALASAALGRAPSDSRALLHPLHGIGAAAMGLTGDSSEQGSMNRQESISRHYYGAKGIGHSERDLIGAGKLQAVDEQAPMDKATTSTPSALNRSAAERTVNVATTAAPRLIVDPFTGEQLIMTVRQNSLLSIVIAHAQSKTTVQTPSDLTLSRSTQSPSVANHFYGRNVV